MCNNIKLLNCIVLHLIEQEEADDEEEERTLAKVNQPTNQPPPAEAAFIQTSHDYMYRIRVCTYIVGKLLGHTYKTEI